MAKRKRFGIILLCMLILAAGVGGMRLLSHLKKDPAKTLSTDSGALVEVIRLTTKDHQVVIRATGTVQARRRADIAPQVSGKIISIAPEFVAGEFFEEGAFLFEVEPLDYELAVAQSRAAIVKAEYELAHMESQARVARTEWDRIRLEGKENPNPLVLYEPQLKNARAVLESAKADLDRRLLDVSRTKIFAPFNCRIRSESIDIGQYVIAGQPVAAISGTDAAEVIVPVPLKDLEWLSIPAGNHTSRQGSAATVTLEAAGRPYEWNGRIHRSLGEVDPKGRMLRLVVRVEDPYGLSSTGPATTAFGLTEGLFVDVRLKGRRLSNAILIPPQALRENDTVWILGDDHRLEIRTVTLVRRERMKIIISGELNPDDALILTYLPGATPGMKLRLAEGSGT